ncbi:hypothetical protein [Paenibacillus sp. 1001270B_150601_E10]|uniref:hypothetical protein n=1 Tax=Paenibacillus sp. 1001270B_150601_E10 TaxID=2787079 RepID=UPI00189C8162|nr:hypothetical protein [Paenibacillus sp. 1001270B_150601_E10]
MWKRIGIITALVLLIAGGAVWWGIDYFTNREVTTTELGVDSDFFNFEFAMDEEELESGGVAAPGDPASETDESPVEKSVPPKGDHNQTLNPQAGQKGQSTSVPSSSHEQEEFGKTSRMNEPPKKSEGNPPSRTSHTQTEEQIRTKYMKLFKRLESTAIRRLETLGDKAKVEYIRYKQGESERSLSDLSSLYLSAAKKLESNVNTAFDGLLERMSSELKANHHGLSLVKEAEQTFREAVEQKKSDMLAKAANMTE